MEGSFLDFAADTTKGDIPLKMMHRISMMMDPDNNFDRFFITTTQTLPHPIMQAFHYIVIPRREYQYKLQISSLILPRYCIFPIANIGWTGWHHAENLFYFSEILTKVCI